MEPINLNSDCLYHVIEQVPLAERLQTVRTVNLQWSETVKRLCTAQKELTLQIGSGENESKWSDIISSIRYRKGQLVKATSSFHSLTTSNLSQEVATFLTNTFPRLRTLAVIVVEPTAENNGNSFLLHLPQLISAYTDTLITLQLVWNVKDAATSFQSVFPSLIASINRLHRLRELSFYDHSDRLEVPPFKLPNLMGVSLERLDFVSFKSSADIVRHWVPSLQGRAKTSKQLQINYSVCPLLSDASLRSLPADIAAHFYNVYACMEFATDLQYLTNLRVLRLELKNTLQMGDVLPQLAKLPHLSVLILDINKDQQIIFDHNNNNDLLVLPSFSALLDLTIYFHAQPFQHAFLNEILRPQKVFPRLTHVTLHLFADRCENCPWKVKVPDDAGGDSAVLEEGSDGLIEQCVTLMATSFAKANLKMYASFPKNVMSYWADFDGDGQLELTKCK